MARDANAMALLRQVSRRSLRVTAGECSEFPTLAAATAAAVLVIVAGLAAASDVADDLLPNLEGKPWGVG